ncbi:MAG: hypothetical protein WA940_00285 [Sphingopyxis sp.]|jgi:uncharacterized small protein (DUF1192 family)
MNRGAAILFSAALMAGCDGAPATRGDLERETADRINNHVKLQSKVEDMELKIKLLREEIEFTQRQLAKLGEVKSRSSGTSLQELSLKAQLKDMTARGACGQYPPEPIPGGGVFLRNKECTAKDLQ